MGGVSRREQKKASTRDDLVRAAVKLFKQHGFDGTTVEMIALEAGSSSRTFHRYFGAKEDVVFGDNADRLVAFGEELASVGQIEHPVEALKEILLRNLTEFGRYGDPKLEAECIELWFEPGPRARWGDIVLQWEQAATDFLARQWGLPRSHSTCRLTAVACVTVIRVALMVGGTEGVEGRVAVAERGFELLDISLGSAGVDRI
jgi:AcrR family transcriptional regulator